MTAHWGFGIVSGAGGCQCGAVRYQLTAPIAQLYACHCTECRRQSASAFGISAIVPPDSVRLAKGTLTLWSRPTASGGRLDCGFCKVCGGRIWHRSARDGSTSIKGGSFDDPIDTGRAIHIWTASMLPGVVIPDGCERYPGEPPDRRDLK